MWNLGNAIGFYLSIGGGKDIDGIGNFKVAAFDEEGDAVACGEAFGAGAELAFMGDGVLPEERGFVAIGG